MHLSLNPVQHIIEADLWFVFLQCFQTGILHDVDDVASAQLIFFYHLGYVEIIGKAYVLRERLFPDKRPVVFWWKVEAYDGIEPSDKCIIDIIFHVRLLDSDAHLQQDVLGVIGVNLVYAAYFLRHDVQTMIESLADNLSVGSVEIDLRGPEFKQANDRLVNLYLVAKGFSSAAIFDKKGHACQSNDLLYKKDVMILRTKYKQKSIPNFDLFNSAVDQFKRSQSIKDKNVLVMIEVLMTNILEKEKELNTEDLEQFAKKAEELCATGNNVIVSNFTRNHKLAQYLSRCKPHSVGISTNIANLKHIFDSSSFPDNYTDELLAYVSDLFSRNVKLYAYPYLNKKKNEIITTRNMPVSEEAKPLFEFLIRNNYITDIENYDSKDVKTV